MRAPRTDSGTGTGTDAGTFVYGETSGCGAPVVLLHGWAMNLRAFDALRAQLSQRYAVTALDLPGHGRSPWPPGCTFARQLQLLAAAVPPEATLIGWSLGGQLALSLAAGPVPRTRRLVLIASTARFAQVRGWTHGLKPATLQRFAQALERDPEQTLDDFIDLQVRGSSHAEQVRTTLRAALDGHGRAQLAALRAGLAVLADNDLREPARRITIPALVLAGQNDRVVPLPAAQALAALLPHAQLQTVRRAGHAPFLSHPGEVAAGLLQFLESTDGAVLR